MGVATSAVKSTFCRPSFQTCRPAETALENPTTHAMYIKGAINGNEKIGYEAPASIANIPAINGAHRIINGVLSIAVHMPPYTKKNPGTTRIKRPAEIRTRAKKWTRFMRRNYIT